MPIRRNQNQGSEENAYAPSSLEPLVFEDFQGMNTSSTRAGVSDKQMWWCDGWMPLAPRRLRTLFGVGDVFWTTPADTSIVYYEWANIGTSSVVIIFVSDGSIYQVTDAGVQTTIAAAGTITDPAIGSIGMSQWSSDWIIIVADQTNGYWLWDGARFYGAGSIAPDITLLYTGTGYTSAPSITPFGGTGSGVTITATEANGGVVGFSIVSAGTGYLAGEVVGLAFSGGGITARTARLTAFTSNGALSTVSITDGGLGYTSAGATASIVGGGGSGALLAISIASTSISFASLTNTGSGYATKPTVLVTDPNNPVARATVGVMPLGVQGTDVETYSGHVWVINGPLLQWTAPGSVQDFSTSAGGGNASSADSFLRVGYTKLMSANGFLYLIADSSINYISGVQTAGTPPTTTFSNQNADPEVGSPFPCSVLTLDRAILFANSYGVHALSGAAVNKISEPLDGFWDTVPNFDGLQLSAAKATIFDKKVWMILSRFIDPATDATVNKLLMFYGGRWWASAQDIDLVYIAGREFQSQLSAWGTDGNAIYPLFTTASDAFTKRAQTKLWDAPGGYQFGKTVDRFWSLFNYQSTVTVASVNVDIENEVKGNVNTYTFTSTSATIDTVSVYSDQYTDVLLHFDGEDGSQVIVDNNSAGSVHTWYAVADAQLDTSTYEFAPSSALFDGTGDYVYSADSADYTLGSADFTVDFWFNCTAAGGSALRMCGQRDASATAASTSWRIQRTSGNVISIAVGQGAVLSQAAGTTQFTSTLNTGWHHLAFVRTGTTFLLFIDGVQEATFTLSGAVNDSSNNLGVGVEGEALSPSYQGGFDEFRLSPGIARWTSNFTPPTEPAGTDTVIPVVNQSSATITVNNVQSGYFVTDPTAIGQQGALLGFTIYTDVPDIELISAMVQPNIVQYRG